jgi:hypothetical protein
VRNPEIDSILGSPEKFYAETANQFLSVRYGETVSISPDRSKIWCSPGAPPDFVRLLAEWMLRRKLLDQRFAMIHASGVKYEGQTIVFPAWRHTGKTNTMLTLLEEGASYISDDRLFVSDDGRIRGYPTDLHLMSYNYRSFPEIAPNTFSSKVRSFISEKVNKMTQSHSSKISKGLNLVNEAVVARNDWRDVTNVFPETETIFKDKLDQIVLLRTTSDPTPHIEKLSKEKLSASLSSINHREWDLDLIEISAAYHSLIDDDTLLGEIEDGIEQQRERYLLMSVLR